MKFKVGDQVLVMGGKDKGMQGVILKRFPKLNRVIVEGANMYTRHFKPMGGQAGRKVRRERALPTANVAIINDQKKPDRIGYQLAKDGTKVRIFRKTGKPVPEPVKPSKKTE